MAREAVRVHEGDIRVRNMPGQGCIFEIDLPLAADVVGASPRVTHRATRRACFAYRRVCPGAGQQR